MSDETLQERAHRLNPYRLQERGQVMNKLICHANECDNSTSETFFHCEQHGGEDGESNE
jgi:hypothetical protein